MTRTTQQNVRVISTILDPAGKSVAMTTSTIVGVSDKDQHIFDQQVSVCQPSAVEFGRA